MPRGAAAPPPCASTSCLHVVRECVHASQVRATQWPMGTLSSLLHEVCFKAHARPTCRHHTPTPIHLQSPPGAAHRRGTSARCGGPGPAACLRLPRSRLLPHPPGAPPGAGQPSVSHLHRFERGRIVKRGTRNRSKGSASIANCPQPCAAEHGAGHRKRAAACTAREPPTIVPVVLAVTVTAAVTATCRHSRAATATTPCCHSERAEAGAPKARGPLLLILIRACPPALALPAARPVLPFITLPFLVLYLVGDGHDVGQLVGQRLRSAASAAQCQGVGRGVMSGVRVGVSVGHLRHGLHLVTQHCTCNTAPALSSRTFT